MADIDWTSLAANVLPAIVGAMGGARSGGMGAIPGALYGAGSSARYSIESNLERDKLNTDIAFRNQTQALAQQRIEQENRQLDLQTQHYNRLDLESAERMKSLGLEQQRHKMELDAATRSLEGQKIFRESLPPDKQVIFDAAENKQQFVHDYYKDKDWEAKTNSSAELLKRMGLDSETARMLGPVGTSHLIGSIMESRAKPREQFGFHYDPNSGYGFVYDKTNGKMTKEKLGDPKGATPEKRTAIEGSLLKTWKEQNPPLARLGEETGDWSSYDEWRASDRGRIEAAYLSGDIDFKQAQGYRESLQRGEQQITSSALDSLKRAYLGVNQGQTEKGFQEYLNTPAGKQNLEAYKRAERNKGRARSSNLPAVADSSAQDLEYAEKNNTSLRGRQTGEPSAPTFAQWKAKYAPNDSGKDYDLQGAYEAGLKPDATHHFPDTFKLPNHPKFSIESKYWKPGMPAGRWEGDKYIPMSGPAATAWVKMHGQNMAPGAKGGGSAKDSLLKDFGL